MKVMFQIKGYILEIIIGINYGRIIQVKCDGIKMNIVLLNRVFVKSIWDFI